MDYSRPGSPVLPYLGSLLRFMSIELMMLFNHLILCFPFSSCSQSFPASGSFLMSQLFTSGGQSIGHFNISPSSEHSGLTSFKMDWLDLPAVQETLKSLLQPQFKSTNSSVLSFLYTLTLTSIHD